MGKSAEDEAYELGLRDGREEAIQEIDFATGGDGEYRYVIGGDPDRHCPTADAMKQRIIDRRNDQLATLKFIAPGLLVLRNMCARAGLKLGEAKAAEMIVELRRVLCEQETAAQDPRP
jgi:hypothetical protein